MFKDFFITLFFLSLSGGFASLFLISLSYITKILFSPKWHYLSGKFILFMFIIPFFYFIPLNRNYLINNYNTIKSLNKLDKISKTTNFFEIIFLVWFIVFLIYFTFHVFCYINFRKNLMKNIYLTNNRYLLDSFNECKEKMKIKKNITIVENDLITTPMLIGILKPMIIFPSNISNILNINPIIFHELTHFKRKDLFIKLIQMVILSIHWFNPIIYFFNKYLNNWCEISCDENAIKNLTLVEKYDYGNSLLNIASKKCPTPRLVTTLSSNAKLLKLRLSLITSNKKHGFLNIIFSIILIGTIFFIPTFSTYFINSSFYEKPPSFFIETQNRSVIVIY